MTSLEEVSGDYPIGRVVACTSDRELSALPDGGEHVVVKHVAHQSSSPADRHSQSRRRTSPPHSSSQPPVSASSTTGTSSDFLRNKSKSVPAPQGLEFGGRPVFMHSQSSPTGGAAGGNEPRQHRRSHDIGIEYTWDPVEKEPVDAVGESCADVDPDEPEPTASGSGSLTLTLKQPGTANTTLERMPDDPQLQVPGYPSLLALAAQQLQRPTLERSLSAHHRERDGLSTPDLVAGEGDEGAAKIAGHSKQRRRSFSIVNKKPSKHSNWASKFRALVCFETTSTIYFMLLYMRIYIYIYRYKLI